MNVKVLKELRQTAKEIFCIEYIIDEYRRPSYVVTVSPDFPRARKKLRSYFGSLDDAKEELKKQRRDYILSELDLLKSAKRTEQEHLHEL